jgi:hypothetical protein
MSRIIISGLISAVLTSPTYSADTVHRLCIRNFTSVKISDVEAEDIMIRASAILSALGQQFVGCKSVSLRKKGIVKSYTTEYPSSVSSEADFNAVKKDDCIKIVERITWCGKLFLSGSVLGCAPVSGDGLAVVRRVSVFNDSTNAAVEPIVWLHEYGHNLGLIHNETGSNSFMSPGLSPAKIGGTADECSVFGPASAAVAGDGGDGTPMTGRAAGATGAIEPGTPMPAEGIADYTDEFLQFIRQPMSNEDIKRFALDHQPELPLFNEAIQNPALRAYKNNIAGILTVIGDFESYGATWSYVNTHYNDPTNLDVNGLLASILTLGILVERLNLGEEEVIRVGTLRDPGYWLERLNPTVEYTSIEDADVPVLTKDEAERAAFDLANQATNGYAATGSEAAAAALQNDINENAAAAIPEELQLRNHSVLSGAQEINRMVIENGALSVFGLGQ